MREARGSVRVVSDAGGTTIIELLVAFLLLSLLMAGAISTFRNTTTTFSDNEVITRAETSAREILEMMAFDLRMAGSGMPLGQAKFTSTDTSLGDAPLPLLTTSTASRVDFRMNPRGRTGVITADFSPSVSSLNIPVEGTSNFQSDDEVYITDATAGGQGGLKGVVNSVSSSALTIASTFVATAGITLKEGALVSVVDEINYTSSGGNVTRTDANGTVTIASGGASFSLTYLDTAGNALTVPLDANEIEFQLSSINISVTVNGERPLSTNDAYAANAGQLVNLRDMNLARAGESTGIIPDPTVAPTSNPTATATARPTATPTSAPTPTATPSETATPVATATPPPTAVPTATPTAVPTATPTAAPTATATARPTPACSTFTSNPTCPSSYCRWSAGSCIPN